MFLKSLVVALITDALDFTFHYFFTNPMESLTYFVIKFLLAFFVAAALFSLKFWQRPLGKKWPGTILAGLIFSALMSAYYRAWELGEAGVPFGSRAPDITGIIRENAFLFSGIWWLGHALFFVVGVSVSFLVFRNSTKSTQTQPS